MFTEALKNMELHQSITKTANNLRSHVRKNNDAVVCITGFRGSGKSLLSMILVHLINKEFDFEKHLILKPTGENITKALNKMPKYSALIVDEAIRQMHNMSFMDPVTIALSKKFQQDRKFNRIVFLNIPDFLELTKAFRKNIVNLWIHIFSRGYGVVFKRSNFYASRDRWFLEQVEKLTSKPHKLKQMQNFEKQIKFALSQPNAVRLIRFPEPQYKDLFVKTGIESRYDSMSRAANLEMDEEGDKEDESSQVSFKYKMAVRQMAAYLHYGFDLPYQTIEKMAAHYNSSTIRQLVEDNPPELKPLLIPKRKGTALIEGVNERLRGLQ